MLNISDSNTNAEILKGVSWGGLHCYFLSIERGPANKLFHIY